MATMTTTSTSAMTMKAFLERVAAFEGMDADLVEKAELELSKLASKAEKRKTSPKALAKVESDETLKSAMLDLMGTEPVTSGEMATSVSEALGETVTTSKVAAMFKALAAEGKVTEGEGKSKGRKVKAFTKVDVETAESVETVDEGVEG